MTGFPATSCRPMHPRIRRIPLAGVLAALLMTGAVNPPTATAGPQRWTSEVGQVSAEVGLDPDGDLVLSVAHADRVVIPDSKLGLLTSGADLSTDLRFLSRTDRRTSDSYRMTTGKRRHIVATATETRLSFAGSGDRRLDLVLRVSDDGVAYRYELPQATTITSEASAFRVPADSTAWLLPYSAWYENDRIETPATTAPAGEYGYQTLIRTGDYYALLAESGLSSAYPGARLHHAAGSDTYTVRLAQPEVPVPAGHATPWRLAIVGDAATIAESTMVTDLAAPSRVVDTSWIRPGKVGWSWLTQWSSPRDLQRQKQYVDFAAANGWPYVLVDEGWDAAWVPELTRYARAEGVDIML